MGEARRKRRAAGSFEPRYHGGPKVDVLREIHAVIDRETAIEVEAALEEYRQTTSPGLTWDVWISALLTAGVFQAREQLAVATMRSQVEPYTEARAAEIQAAEVARGEG